MADDGQRWRSWHYRYLRCGVGTLFASLGLRRALHFADWLAEGIYELNTASRRAAEQNLSLALGSRLREGLGERVVRDSFVHLGRFWIEVIYLRRRLRANNWQRAVQVDDAAIWRRLAADRRGAIIVTTYLGNWAVLGYALNQLLGGLSVLIHVADQPVLRGWIEDLCRVPGLRLIHASQGLDELPAALRGGRHVLMIGEHVRRAGRGVPVSMLGGVRMFYPTVSLLAWGCQVPIVVATCRRLDGVMRFCLESIEMMEPPADGDRAILADLTRRYAAGLERAICLHPEQYPWARRWDPG